MAHAAANRALTVGVSPAPMAGVVAVKVAVKDVAKDVAKDGVAGADEAGANAPVQASVTAWTPTASRPATMACTCQRLRFLLQMHQPPRHALNGQDEMVSVVSVVSVVNVVNVVSATTGANVAAASADPSAAVAQTMPSGLTPMAHLTGNGSTARHLVPM